MSKPLISVIIVAYNRTEYLPLAVDSVLNQSLARDEYDIVVSKNFSSAYDKVWEEKGVKLLFYGEAGLGGRVAHALTSCEGDYVCLLEDDDMFEKNKLSVVKEVFTSRPTLTYLFNSIQTIDRTGRRLGVNLHAPLAKEVYLNEPFKRVHWLYRLYNEGFGWHNSAISVRKTLLEENLESVKRVNMALDSYIYWLNCASNKPLLLHPYRLTLYRAHQANASAAKPCYSEHLKQRSSMASKIVADISLLQPKAEHTPFKDALNELLVFWRLQLLTSSERTSANDRLLNLGRLIYYNLVDKNTFNPRRLSPSSILMLAAISVANQKLATRIGYSNMLNATIIRKQSDADGAL
ncbi:MAG: glycosyltransferase [Thermoprotei archaeon]